MRNKSICSLRKKIRTAACRFSFFVFFFFIQPQSQKVAPVFQFRWSSSRTFGRSKFFEQLSKLSKHQTFFTASCRLQEEILQKEDAESNLAAFRAVSDSTFFEPPPPHTHHMLFHFLSQWMTHQTCGRTWTPPRWPAWIWRDASRRCRRRSPSWRRSMRRSSLLFLHICHGLKQESENTVYCHFNSLFHKSLIWRRWQWGFFLNSSCKWWEFACDYTKNVTSALQIMHKAT